MYYHLLLGILSFIGIWIGTGFAVSSVEKISHRLKISSFAVSFLILGLFTSISEFSVGINSVLDNDPEIFVGNLIGASIVLFLMIIPLLAITGKQIKIPETLKNNNLLLPMIVISLPVVLSLDREISKLDGIIALALYTILAVNLQAKKGLLEKAKSLIQFKQISIYKEIAKILVGVLIIFSASHFIVEQTKYFSDLYNISPFIISILVISIGTNLPELSFVFRSLVLKNNQVAFGDYIGSAAFNTFLFGLLTLIYGKNIVLSNNYITSSISLIVGTIIFYIFAKSKNTISRLEGVILLGIYILFVTTEFLLIK
jgi:cation:H+ antiporter